MSLCEQMSRAHLSHKPIDYQYKTSTSFRRFVALGVSTATDPMTRRAASSFLHFSVKNDEQFNADSLRYWISDMLRTGVAVATRKRYFGKLHTLYLKWCSEKIEQDPFEEVRNRVKVQESPVHFAFEESDFQKIQEIVARIMAHHDRPQIADILVYLLLNPMASARDAVELTFDTPVTGISTVDSLVQRQPRAGRRQYVFSLAQSRKRMPQLLRELSAALNEYGRQCGLSRTQTDIPGVLRRIWAEFARRNGVVPGVIRAILETAGELPAACAYLRVVDSREITVTEKRAIAERIAEAIYPHRPRWHVFHLRTGFTISELIRDITFYKPDATLYHPTHAMALRKGKKLTFTERSYIPGVIFVKLPAAQVPELMARIGHKAWCYRTVNTPDAPYATIPDDEMTRFQQYAGNLTPDVAMQLGNIADFGAGTRVRITGGVMEGYEGTIHSHGEDRTFTLQLSADTVLHWTVRVPAHMIEPV